MTRAFGEIIDYKVDWNTGLMGDAITSVAKMYGVSTTVPLGWNIYITENYDAFEFDVYYGKHKHIHQNTLPPVVFSEEFGNIKNATYEYSIKDWRNVAYMTWNDGTADKETPLLEIHQKVQQFHSTGKKSSSVHPKRFKMRLSVRGSSELNKRPHVESFTAEIINNDNTMSTYKEDWDLGDIVTVQSNNVLKNFLITIDSQITEIEETYDSGEYTISATFGEGKLSFVQLIKQSIDQKK